MPDTPQRVTDCNSLYKYFLYGGYKCYIFTKVTGILTVTTVLLFLAALFSVSVSVPISISFHTGGASITVYVVTSIYTTVSVFLLIRDARKMYITKKVYNGILGLSDSDLACIDWPEVSQRIINSNLIDCRNNIELSNKVNMYDNYFIYLVSTGPLKDFPVLTKPTEWFIRRVVFGYVFVNSQVTDDVYNSKIYQVILDDTSMKFRRYLLFICGLSVFLIPGVFVYLIIHGLVRYSKDIRDKPMIMTARTFTTFSKWKFREYNEYKNQFDRRMNIATVRARKYTEMFASNARVYHVISRFICFLASALLLFIVALSLVYEGILTAEILLGKTGLWYTFILTIIISITKVTTPPEAYKSDYVRRLSKITAHTHYSKPEWTGKEHTGKTLSDITDLFRHRAVVYLIEVVSVFTLPYLAYTLSKKAEQLILFFSMNPNTFSGTDPNISDPKLEASFINFNNNFSMAGSYILN